MIRKSILLFLIVFFALSCTQRKNNNKDALALAALYILANSCDNSAGNFWATDFNTGDYYCANASLVGSTSTVDVYLENGLSSLQSQYGITPPDFQSIANSFTNQIQPNTKPAIGSPTDINGDGKVTVLFYGVRSANSSTGSFVGGYVDPANFFAIPPGYQGLYSNEREIIYLNGLQLLALRQVLLEEKQPDAALETLAHEYQHLVRIPYEIGHPGATSPVPLPQTQSEAAVIQFDDHWIDEGSSEVVADIAGYGPQAGRYSCLLGDPSSSCVDGVEGIPLFQWGGNLYSYAYAYAFMAYLYNSAGSSTTTRNVYMKDTVSGTSYGARGSNVTSMMQIFSKSASNYQSSVLGTSYQGIFEKLFASFWAQTLQYPSSSNAYYGNSTAVSLSSLYSSYPYPSAISPLLKKPSNFPAVTGSSFDLFASEMYRVSGSSSGPSDSNTVVVTDGTTEYVVFNGSLTSSSFASSTASLLSKSEKPKWSASDYLPSKGSGCPSPYFAKLLKYNISNYMQGL